MVRPSSLNQHINRTDPKKQKGSWLLLMIRMDRYDRYQMVVFDAKEVFAYNKEGLWRLLVRTTSYVCFVLSFNFIVLFI